MKPGFSISLLIFFLLALSSPAPASEWAQASGSGPFDLLPSNDGTTDPALKHSPKGVSLDGLGLEFVFDETTTLNLGYGDFDDPTPSLAQGNYLIKDESGKLGFRLTRMF